MENWKKNSTGAKILLRSYLIRAKLYPLKGSVGSFKCKNKHYQVYLNVKETDSFLSSMANRTYEINHRFSCVLLFVNLSKMSEKL